ncbi:MAG: SIS domain-containing protein [Rhodobacteraceae bacterium]|nr:SIS domain-containing protein [Paracoccaceae bacterium]
MTKKTHMRHEIGEIPAAVTRLLHRPELKALAESLRSQPPHYLCTIARGSSDHAATYLKYASELVLGLPVASLGPSVASIYRAKLHLDGAGCIAISQSGQSPDICAMAKTARAGGALTMAITNNPRSPLAQQSNHVIDICAGLEKSVAATKTFVTSAVAGLALIALWRRDSTLIKALNTLPEKLEAASRHTWPNLRKALYGQKSLLVLGRGPSLAMASEAALKFKETCQIHAEAYSSAEVLHGPVSIVEPGFPVLLFAARDAAETTSLHVAETMAKQGANVFITSDKATTGTRLGFTPTDHPLTDPLAVIVSFYAFIERLALDLGINPDRPRNLEKITETV